MSKNFNYTSIAQRLFARFPVGAYVGIQINFWVAANILLVAIMQLQAASISEAFGLPRLTLAAPSFFIAVLLGIVYGAILGSTDYYLHKKVVRQQPLGRLILIKLFTSVSVLLLLYILLRFVLFGLLAASSVYGGRFALGAESWKYLFLILLIYYFIMTILNSFINQVNAKYGPGVLIPLLLGRYRNPHEEERVFMFMDLKSSTTIAENLGHLKYSSFIRDCFMDINQMLLPFNAAVYQYVGDEIVLTWSATDGLRNLTCIKFFFACERQFLKRREYYTKQYGFLPYFKAGLHMGKVTAVEIGDIKRDIAYHGDTLNTTSRIQSVCNEYGKLFLVSDYLSERSDLNKYFKTEHIGLINLKGKDIAVGIVSVEEHPKLKG